MNLRQIRTEFTKISGRYDLVTDPSTFSDNGADEYIKAGQRALERRLNVKEAKAKFYKDITAGDYLIQVEKARAIWEAWILTDTARTQLERITEGTMRDYSDTVPINNTDQGTPTEFYTANLRRSPETISPADSTLIGYHRDTVSPASGVLAITGIVLYPPADQAYALELVGLFYNSFPSANRDSNYWTENYPMLLIMSGLQQLEYMYKGSKSSTSWDALIQAELANIEKDAIEEEISHVDQMEG